MRLRAALGVLALGLGSWSWGAETGPVPLDQSNKSVLSLATQAPEPAAKETIDGILVSGSAEFVSKTKAALKLLQKSTSYKHIRSNLGAIQEAPCSGTWVEGKTPTYHVGKRTWDGDLVWFAGTIAHDSLHARLYTNEKKRLKGAEPADSVWTGAEAEKKCLRFQLGVLGELGADRTTRDYVAKLIGAPDKPTEGPVYQNIGAGSADVCDKRDW
jgi:hypothetical protein